eukprot:jgi/Tetstr1/446499/TSEL_034027.t1
MDEKGDVVSHGELGPRDANDDIHLDPARSTPTGGADTPPAASQPTAHTLDCAAAGRSNPDPLPSNQVMATEKDKLQAGKAAAVPQDSAVRPSTPVDPASLTPAATTGSEAARSASCCYMVGLCMVGEGPPHVFAEAHIERSLRAVEGKVIDMTMVGTKNNSASEGGELSEVWSFHAGSALSCTAASPDGAFIALGTETGVILATVGIPEKEGSLTPQLLAHYPGEPTSALAFAPPRGKNEPSGLLVAGTKAGSIRLLSVEPSFKELKTLSLIDELGEDPAGDKAVRHVVSNPVGELFAAMIGRCMLIFTCKCEVISRVELDVDDCHAPIWLPCGTLLCAAGESIYSWATVLVSHDPRKPTTMCAKEVVPSRNGAKITACGVSELRLAIGYDDGTIKIFFGTPEVGLNCSRIIHLSDAGLDKVSNIVFDMSSDRLYLCAFSETMMAIWDLTQHGAERPFLPVAVFNCHERITKVALNKHAAMVVAATASGNLLLFKADNKSRTPALGPCRNAGDKLTVDFIEWHPTGLIFTASKDGQLCFWKIPNGPIQEAISAEHLSCSMMSLLSISPDGAHDKNGVNGNGKINGNGHMPRGRNGTTGNGNGNGRNLPRPQAEQAAITETPNIGASTPVTPQALPVRPVRVDPASGSTVSPAPLSDSDQGSHGPPSATSVPGETEECKTPRPVPAAQPPQDRHSEAPVGESALSSSKSSKTPHFGVASHGHGAPMWPRPHMGSSPPDRPPPPTAMAAAAAGMPYLPGGWYVPPGAPPSPQIGAVMPGGIPSNGQMMPQMMPQQPWQQLYQQQMAQQLWQQQQQQQYMQYYYNQPPTTSMYPAMQMQPPSMMPMPGGMVPGMDMHEMHVDNLRVDTAQRDHHPYVNVLTLYVGNLAARVDEPVLMGAFNHIGPITNIQVIRDKVTGMSRGFAFITFEHPQYAQLAMYYMHGVVMQGNFEGRTLRVAPSNRNLQMGSSSWAN